MIRKGLDMAEVFVPNNVTPSSETVSRAFSRLGLFGFMFLADYMNIDSISPARAESRYISTRVQMWRLNSLSHAICGIPCERFVDG